MKIKYLVFLSALFLSCTFFLPTLQAEQKPGENNFQISGYYKNLFTTTKSTATQEDISADLNRFRLEFKKQLDPWQFYLTLDNEAIVNDFANTSDFNLIRSKIQNNLAYWDLDKTSVDNDHLFLRHSIYRAYIKYYSPEFQATLGKQAIDWGRLRFYSPMDVFNPAGPIDLEPEERVGVDAFNFNFSPHDFALNAVLVPGEDAGETSFGIKLSKTLSPYDVALTLASIKKDKVFGVSFDGYIKQAGFRGEIAHVIQDNGKVFPRIALGADYNFSEKVYLLVEQFFNGGHEDNDANAFASSYRLARQVLSLKRNLTSVFVKYSLTALLDFNQAVIYDWDGKSVVVNPYFKYNMTENIDINVGVQHFWGNEDSEFGTTNPLYYLEFKWFF